MAIGDNLTLVKTESGVPWYKAFGVMQHLTPTVARTMLQIPWYAWEDAGIETKLDITRIQVQPTPTSVRPIISIGVSDISGIGATVENGVITREGGLSSHCETQCIESSIVGEPYTVYGGYMNGDIVDMSFYTNERNEVYIGLAYGAAYNRGTSFVFGYKNASNFYATTGTTPNNSTYPANDKALYCDGVSINNVFACVDLSCLFKACSFDFKVSCPMFSTYNGFVKFRDTGDNSEEIEALTNTDPGIDRSTVLFLEAQEYKSEFSIRQPNEKIGNKKRIEFYVESTDKTGNKIDYITRAVWGFVHNDSTKKTRTDYANAGNIKNNENAVGYVGGYLTFSADNTKGLIKNVRVPSGQYHLKCSGGLTALIVYEDLNGLIYKIDLWNSMPLTFNVTQESILTIIFNKNNEPFTLTDYSPELYTLTGGGELTDYKNITFVKNPAFNVYKILENGVDVTRSYDWSRRFTVWKNNVLFNDEYYWSNIVTNMYIFETYQKGLDAIQSGIIDGLLSDSPIPDTTPTPLSDNEIDYDGGMSETFLLTKADMNKLADRLTIEVSADGSVLRNMFVGLSMHNNPIDVVIDLFALPIQVDDFVETEETSIDFNPRTHQDPNDGGDDLPSNT